MECSELPLNILAALFVMMLAAGTLLALSIGGMIWQVLIWRKGRITNPNFPWQQAIGKFLCMTAYLPFLIISLILLAIIITALTILTWQANSPNTVTNEAQKALISSCDLLIKGASGALFGFTGGFGMGKVTLTPPSTS